MARWQRLYHKHIASFFNRGLYWKGFATFGRARGGLVFLVSWVIGTARIGAEDSSVHENEYEERLRNQKGRSERGVEEVKQFPAVERRRNAATSSDREKGEVAVFQELGKALTSSLQLDQVLRTIMEKIDEFLRPDNWSLLLLDEEKQELYFELAVGKASQALRDVRIKMGQGIAGWGAQHGETVVVPDTSKDTRFFSKVDEKTRTETQSIVAVPSCTSPSL